MITSFNFYYAQPGQEDAVLRQRLLACDVRDNMGVPRGRVLARSAGAAELPDVIWEHQFDNVNGHHADMAARAASAEFEAIRAGMRKLCRRFERPLFEISGSKASNEQAPASRVVALDWIFCAPSHGVEALAVAEKQAMHYAGLGIARGRLLRLITPGNDLPELVWQREHADMAAYEQTMARIAAAAGVQIWPYAAEALAARVERSVWSVQ
jgi:hypothetical protein